MLQQCNWCDCFKSHSSHRGNSIWWFLLCNMQFNGNSTIPPFLWWRFLLVWRVCRALNMLEKQVAFNTFAKIDRQFVRFFFLNVPNSRKLFYNSTRFFFFFISPVVPSKHFAHIENRYNIVFRIFNCLCAPASSFTWWDQSTLNHIASFISVW